MAGASLKCGECHAHLKSMEEARQHADLTSHFNFLESTEAVLNIVCKTCAKPCRSKTESDLHTKRTGHSDFVDESSDAAKLIHLEVPMEEAEKENLLDASTQCQQEGMVHPCVDNKLFGELESMGFPKTRATRALHFSGNKSLEAAVDWIVEHENDKDIDEMPLVPINKNVDSRKPSLTPEEVKIKAQELRDRARQKKLEEEKKMEIEREKERIRVGKELLEAKRIEEENERKRLNAMRKAEKEEEKRAREIIRQKLEEDKVERRRKLGLPTECPAATKPDVLAVTEKKKTLPVGVATISEQMKSCLRSIKQKYKDDAKVQTAFPTLLTYIGNVVKNPKEEKFRKIRLNNQAFQDKIGSSKECIEFLQLCGFEKCEYDVDVLFMREDRVNEPLLKAAGCELNSAMTNPYFGILLA